MLRFKKFDRIPANVLRLSIARWLFLTSIVGGTIGFRFLEGYSFVDSLYMAIITFSTVGFGEVAPLSPSGRLFVSVLIVFNTAVLAYILAAFSYYIIDGKIFHSMHASNILSKVDRLKGHVIVCGFGRYGQEVGEHLRRHGQDYVVIDLDKERLEQLGTQNSDLLYIAGDATEDDVLLAAGVERASGLISALLDDSDNMFIVLSARQLNPELRIVSRAQQARSEAKLKMAGADHVIMPERMGGFYMATLVSKPRAMEFFRFIASEQSADMGFESIDFEDLSTADQGKPLRELDLRKDSGINIIGHRRENGDYIVNPDPDTRLQTGECFIALGSAAQLDRLKKWIAESN